MSRTFTRVVLANHVASEYKWPLAFARAAVDEFLDRFTDMVRAARDWDQQRVQPSSYIDAVWRVALWYTQEYAHHCNTRVGFMVHYSPKKAEADAQKYADTLMLYKIEFGEDASVVLWPAVAKPAAYSQWLRNKKGFAKALEAAPRLSGTKRAADTPIRFPIVVKLLTGQTITFEVEPHTTILQLKSMINAKEGTPVDQQRIVHCGTPEDHTTMEENAIKRDTAVHLVLKLRGC